MRWWHILELTAAAVAVFFWCLYRHFGCFTLIHSWYESSDTWETANLWLPSSKHEGLAGLSFLSLATGLNFAMVKFEAFKKTVEDFQAHLKKEVEKMIGADYSGAMADDEFRKKLHAEISKFCDRALGKAYLAHEKSAIFWREVALPLAVLGVTALFCQYSVGGLGALFLLPVLGSWIGKLRCKNTLKAYIGPLREFHDDLKQQVKERQSEVNNLLNRESRNKEDRS